MKNDRNVWDTAREVNLWSWTGENEKKSKYHHQWLEPFLKLYVVSFMTVFVISSRMYNLNYETHFFKIWKYTFCHDYVKMWLSQWKLSWPAWRAKGTGQHMVHAVPSLTKHVTNCKCRVQYGYGSPFRCVSIHPVNHWVSKWVNDKDGILEYSEIFRDIKW